MSYVYFACPVTLARASIRGTSVPTTLRLSLALQGIGSLSGISNSISLRLFLNPKRVLIFCGMTLTSLHSLRCGKRCVEDVRIGAAAAEIAGDRFLHILYRRSSISVEKGFARHYHSRRAEAALERIEFDEALLQ